MTSVNFQKVMEKSKPQIWFVYSGIGSQWVGMGRELLIFNIFQESILKCSAVIEQYGISPRNLIAEGTEEDFKNPLICLTCIITIQVTSIIFTWKFVIINWKNE